MADWQIPDDDPPYEVPIDPEGNCTEEEEHAYDTCVEQEDCDNAENAECDDNCWEESGCAD